MRRLLTETPRASLTSVGRSSVCLSVCHRSLGAEYAENSRKYVYFVFHPAQNGIRIPRIPRVFHVFHVFLSEYAGSAGRLEYVEYVFVT